MRYTKEKDPINLIAVKTDGRMRSLYLMVDKILVIENPYIPMADKIQ